MQIINDGKQITLTSDHETFVLAGIAQLKDTFVFLTLDGKVFEIVTEYLPLAGQTVRCSIFDVAAANTPLGEPEEAPQFIPVRFASEPTKEDVTETPEPEVPQEPQQETPAEETVNEPEPEQAEAPDPQQQEETPTAEPEAPEVTPEPEAVTAEPESEPEPEPEAVTAEPESEPEPKAERIADRVARGEQVSLMDMLDEIKADKAAGRTPDHEKKAGKKGKNKRHPTASA